MGVHTPHHCGYAISICPRVFRLCGFPFVREGRVKSMGDFLTAIWLCDVGNIALAPVEQQDEWLSGLLTGAPVRRAERVLRIAAPAARL